MTHYRKAQIICLLQYFLMLLLHIIYAYFYCSHEQFLKTIIWSGMILLFISICTVLLYKWQILLACITFISVVVSAYYIGVILHTLAFAMLMYLVTELIVSLYLNRLYVLLFGIFSTLAEISFMIFFPDILLEMVPSLSLYGCYIVCYVLGVVNMYFLVSSAGKYLVQMRAKAQEAEEAAAHKSQFLAKVSHEIRTPMNVIYGMTQMLSKEELSGNAREYIANIERASTVLLSLINDILDISKMDSGKFKIHEEKYNLHHVIDDVSNLISVKVDEEKVKFHVITDNDLPKFLIGDADRLKQILINILNNAVKFTHEGEITFHVKCVKMEEPFKVMLHFTVSDTGIGIRQEDINRLFDSFEQLDEERNRNIEGTGLGLSICKNLAALMNGSISVESTYGEGSSFFVSIPQRIPEGSTKEELPEDDWTVPANACVLVVDDMKANLMVDKGLLSLLSINADLAESGREALEMMERRKYDLVFLDHMMPDMDGEETLHRIRLRTGENFENIPVIALTANAAIGGREEFIKRGFTDYISKPIEIDKLKAVLREYL
ncbi:MAG: ATP-binding protein [Bacillota bacterium]|nr:ATP-binding protein [Bacillota bacterium]